MTVDDNLTAICCHTPPHVKEERGHIQGDSIMLGLAIGSRHTHYLNDTDTTHSLEHAEHELAIFLIKKKTNMKYQNSP